ncbi:AlpA family transcriptional regulator [Streptomyces sp. ISL-100]|uniref:helix-turn-helix transcriptional regulator n=1 Tax=Streptomyces sp. ISL-100 TaxID=2819173 RepID=UPI001BE68A26|nr:helix-turn-helix domain-containing protein [Streptomyces sp. ISL-100]MBT2401269.1 helix-turn-helix domain-containing protein [Streptomyces sp. ISL-100]
MAAPRSLATPDEVAMFLGLPTQTLAQWRYLAKGPRSIKVGRHVRYRWTDVERWLDRNARGDAAA